MPWSIPIPMLVSGDAPLLEVTISSTAQDYDLFAAAGSPAFPVDLYVTLNSGVVIDTMTAEGFAFGSNIFFTVLGTIRGRSGAGGAGGNAIGGSPAYTREVGLNGSPGGHAFLSTAGIHLYLDVDQGNIWGGGGGGGGGGAQVITLFGTYVPYGGGGGGTGQGWNQQNGGAGGTATGNAGAEQGLDGGIGNSVGPGAGGAQVAAGGNGGAWGLPGSPGTKLPVYGANGGFGGTHGRAILVTGGSFVTLTGGKDIATLEAEGRIRGGIVSG